MKNHETELIENEELCDLYRKKAEQLVLQMTIEELADQTLNSAPPIERLNIKGYDWWNEGCTVWQEPVRRRFFRRQSGLRQHLTKT